MCCDLLLKKHQGKFVVHSEGCHSPNQSILLSVLKYSLAHSMTCTRTVQDVTNPGLKAQGVIQCIKVMFNLFL